MLKLLMMSLVRTTTGTATKGVAPRMERASVNNCITALAALVFAASTLAASHPALAFGYSANDPNDNVIGFGSDEFPVETQRGPVTVYTYMPAGFTASSPVLIVMPGTRRDADRHLAFDYYDVWDGLADELGALLLVPEFTDERWPGSWRYQAGNVRTRDLRPIAWKDTAFNVVERAFVKAIRLTGSSRRKFDIFGHGGGAQFVQRYVLHSGGRYIDRAIAANPGWYMLPDDEYTFPYGLQGAPIPRETLKRAFATDFVLLLGTADVNHARPLRTNEFTRQQGRNRYERGHFYFERSRHVASRLGAGFNWRLREVPGVAHDQSRMAPPAAGLFAIGGR